MSKNNNDTKNNNSINPGSGGRRKGNQQRAGRDGRGGDGKRSVGRGRGRGNRQRASRSAPVIFKGPIDDIADHAFQVRAERARQNQSGKTMEALKVYLSIQYPCEASHITYLIDELKTPVPKKPAKLKKNADEIDKEA